MSGISAGPPSEDPSIIAVTKEVNTRSRSLFEKLGMEQFDSSVEFNEPQASYSMTPVEDSFASRTAEEDPKVGLVS